MRIPDDKEMQILELEAMALLLIGLIIAIGAAR